MKTKSAIVCIAVMSACCSRPPDKPYVEVPLEECISACVQAETEKYMRKIYGTADQFIGQFKELCRDRLQGGKCSVGGHNGREIRFEKFGSFIHQGVVGRGFW